MFTALTRPRFLNLAVLAFASFASALDALPAIGDQSVDLSSAAGQTWIFQPEKTTDWKTIQVPAGGWRTQGYTCDSGIYRITIALPKIDAASRVKLEFDAVNFGARVLAGPDAAHLVEVASHINGWMPFAADLTGRAGPDGRVLVQVEVAGRAKFKVNGKYTVPEGATWYPGVADGILRGVRLRTVSAVRIDDVWVRTTLGPDTLKPQITLANDTDAPATVTLRSKLDNANLKSFRYPKIAPATATIPARGRVTLDLPDLAWKLGESSYWWPNVPYTAGHVAQLHRLDAVLEVAGAPVHSFSRRFGFREFKVVGNYYTLNGVRCNLRGDNQQEANFGTDGYGIKPGFGPPTASNPGWPQAVDNIQRLNFNVLRIHQIPATPYMLDVCDEMGLLIVGESPLRGSESGEDYQGGKTNMLNMVRELVARDRHHPSVVIWCPANEWVEPIRDSIKVIHTLDQTRPIIADGIADIGPDVINMEHYVDGIGALSLSGAKPRADRPYGETEAIWFNDNSPRGFAWMATSVRVRRIKNNADLRNYVLNNVWPNYVPGETDKTQVLESAVKDYGGGPRTIMPPITEPWSHPNIRLMQDCFHPLTACDIDFDLRNARSNVRGEWPVFKPRLPADTRVTRRLAVFNDEFFGDRVTLRWQLRQGDAKGRVLDSGKVSLVIAPGTFVTQEVSFTTPSDGEAVLMLSVHKGGTKRFVEDRIAFRIGDGGDKPLVPAGDYRIVSEFSQLALGIPTKAASDGPAIVQLKTSDGAVWTLRPLGPDRFTLIDRSSGLALAAAPGLAVVNTGNRLVLETPGSSPHQVWRVEESADGIFTLQNTGDQRFVDVAEYKREPGTRIWLWTANHGDNQLWRFTPAGR